MKCLIPEISWHNRGPVLSIDLQPGDYHADTQPFWRLASAGNDTHVLVWHVTLNENDETAVSCVADLKRHQKTVNIVRFSPSGEFLASADDESIIIIWKQQIGEFSIPVTPNFEDDIINQEQWNSVKVLRGHIEDVYDLSWSPNSNCMVSASLDNSIILWDVQKSKKSAIIADYNKGFPQGVAWDPTNKYVASIASDRLCRLIDIKTKKTVCRVGKSKIPAPSGNSVEGKVVRLFHDDTLKSFFRRLTFSPDGNLLIVPTGIIESQEPDEKPANCTVVFSRFNLKEPIAILPSIGEVTNVVRCCPVYFKLRESGPPSLMALPYRMVFAVATENSVMIYDTQQVSPIAIISNIHYTRLTDLCWSSDGLILIASSSDGYCSIIHFQAGELGEIHEMPRVNDEVQMKDESKDSMDDDKSTTAPYIELDANAVDIDITQSKSADTTTTPKSVDNHVSSEESNNNKYSQVKSADYKNDDEKNGNVEEKVTEVEEDSSDDQEADETEDFQLVLEDTVNESEKSNVKSTPPKSDKPPTLISRTPRRVQLITLSSPKRTKAE